MASENATEPETTTLLSRIPISAGPIIITLIGDAILPRGGTISLKTLTALLAGLGVKAGQARTALSRLVVEGWLERSRTGRETSYRLAASRLGEFQAAMQRVYAPAPDDWSGAFDQVVLLEPNAATRAARRVVLEHQGFGAVAPNTLIRPAGLHPQNTADVAAPATHDVIGRFVPRSGCDLVALARTVWPLADAAHRFEQFCATFSPVLSHMRGRRVLGATAFEARIRAAHAFRRAVLRDPGLPAALLPADWPGLAARRLCAEIYGTALIPSEDWLSRTAERCGQILPDADEELHRRFLFVTDADKLQISLNSR